MISLLGALEAVRPLATAGPERDSAPPIGH
jgi:hypothetical protein